MTAVEIDGLISVYSPETGQLLALNETASDVWRLCDGEHDRADIVALLASAYDVPPDVVARDVAVVLATFEAQGLLPGTGSA